ncbi:MAG: hypothetical protein QOD25_2469 [Alphaproteobacteria bacterium]|nr:hypothetical protein [Alphaproteobacteria bacterium]
MAASETDALLIEAGAGVGVGAEPDRRLVIFARLALLVAFLGLWQLVVAVGLVDAFWISAPALIAQELWHLLESGALVSDVAVTIYEALVAFVISSVLGIICGLCSRARRSGTTCWRRSCWLSTVSRGSRSRR